jgi:hypothetical protein
LRSIPPPGDQLVTLVLRHLEFIDRAFDLDRQSDLNPADRDSRASVQSFR